MQACVHLTLADTVSILYIHAPHMSHKRFPVFTVRLKAAKVYAQH